MREIDTLPENVRFVANGTAAGRTWTRWTDGERDYVVMYDPETRDEVVYEVED